MRRDLRRSPQSITRGFTLVELMVAIAIAVFIVAAGLPMYSDYQANTALRQGGNSLLSEALYAQSEAIKRNSPVNLVVTTTTLSVVDVANNDTLRTRDLPAKVSATAATVTFGGAGRPQPFGTSAQVDVSMENVTCSDRQRCPRLLVQAGGGVRLCGNQLDCTQL